MTEPTSTIEPTQPPYEQRPLPTKSRTSRTSIVVLVLVALAAVGAVGLALALTGRSDTAPTSNVDISGYTGYQESDVPEDQRFFFYMDESGYPVNEGYQAVTFQNAKVAASAYYSNEPVYGASQARDMAVGLMVQQGYTSAQGAAILDAALKTWPDGSPYA